MPAAIIATLRLIWHVDDTVGPYHVNVPLSEHILKVGRIIHQDNLSFNTK